MLQVDLRVNNVVAVDGLLVDGLHQLAVLARQLAAGQQAPQHLGDLHLAEVILQRVAAVVVSARRAAEALDEVGGGHHGELQELEGFDERDAGSAGHRRGAVDERERLLEAGHDGLEALLFKDFRRASDFALEANLAVADERQRHVRERCEVAACAERALLRDNGVNAAARMARTTSSSKDGPPPAACVRSRLYCNSLLNCGGTMA